MANLAYPAAYLVLTRSQQKYAELLDLLPHGKYQSLQQSLVLSNKFRIIAATRTPLYSSSLEMEKYGTMVVERALWPLWIVGASAFLALSFVYGLPLPLRLLAAACFLPFCQEWP